MNKTININLGGFFFHIDESAYQKLNRYLDSIGRSLSDDPQGKNEIISDIEARISELLSERITDARQVVNESDIDEIITIMGQPEDYAEAEEGYAETGYTHKRRNTNGKKLYRDGDDKFLGGVASGIAHYLEIDTIWIRLGLVALFFGAGFGVLIYIILWILLPEARTTTEKLQMEGEPVNIDNIEKKIREEFSNVSENVRNAANQASDKLKDGANEISEKLNQKIRKSGKNNNGIQDFLNALGNIILAFFKIIGKFIGVILIFVSAAVLISFVIGIFSVGSLEFLSIDSDFIHYPAFFSDATIPRWLLATFIFILAGIPFLILLVLGLRILSSNVKQFSKTTSLTLLGIWLVALLGIIFTGIEFGASKAYNGVKIERSMMNFVANDTIKLRMINDDELFYQNVLSRDSFNNHEVSVDGIEKTYSSNVVLDVEPSETNEAYIQVRKQSEGRKKSVANKNASELEYNYTIDEGRITLDAYFLSAYKNLFKDERVRVTLYVPEGVTVLFGNSTKNFLNRIDNTEDIYDRNMVNHHFLMTQNGFECTDCNKEEENESDDF
jgi:phage shock protein PspC (stress-responsive transcriptional regulator)